MFSIAPHVEGRITIRPYACVIWTFANIDVNTCKYTCKYTEKHHGHGVSMFACVVGAICKSPTLQFAYVIIHSHSKFTHVFNCPHVGGLIAISPYTCVFWTFANIHVNTQKTSWAWYGFLCVCRRGELQFALVANRPYRGLCFQALKIVKINTINKIKSINSKKFFIFAL